MKKLLLLLITAQHLFCYGQNDSAVITKTFRASVTQIGSTKAYGYLKAINDSVISLTDRALIKGVYDKKVKTVADFHYSSIGKVAIRRKGATGTGILYGSLIGLASGVIWGYSGGDDRPGIISFTAGQKAIIGGFSCAVGGAIIGAVIGSVVKKTFMIGGKKERFDQMRSAILARM